MPSRPAPIPDPARIALLARMHRAVQEQEAVVWETAVAFYHSGTPVADLAEALGMSVRSFYRRLSSPVTNRD